MGAARVGGKTTHNTKKPQPTFAAAVDILPYYAKKKLSRSLDEREDLYSLFAVWGGVFATIAVFSLFFRHVAYIKIH